jgi:hypothetical protein
MRIAIALALAWLASCATEPTEMAQATQGAVLAPALTKKGPTTASLTFKRDTGISNAACSFRLFIDGAAFADLRTGEFATIHVPPGEHIIGARSNGICFAGNAEMQVNAKTGDVRVYRVSVTSGGSLALQPTAF